MHNFSHLEAARWGLDCWLKTEEELPTESLQVPSPNSWEYVAILRAANRLYREVIIATTEAEGYYRDDLKGREEYTGRLVDISMPVDFSSGIVNTSKLIAEANEAISANLEKIEQVTEQASFDSDTEYERLSRKAINYSRGLAEFGSIHLHAHLWASWIVESLSQADRVHQQLPQKDHFKGMVDSVYSYLAHPPLIVATIGSTALIEEVGSRYINKFTDGHVNPDETRCGYILDELEEIDSREEGFDFAGIKTTIVQARNDYGHYIRKRKPIVDAEDLAEFIDLCTQCIRLALDIVRDMLRAEVTQYHVQILHSGRGFAS
jgi:hypothetical protein